MAGLDSGIKLHAETTPVIDDLEKKKLGYLILVIKKLDDEKHDKVVVEAKKTKEECEEQVKNDGVALKGGETATWYCFRKHLESLDIAYGCGFLDYKSTDQRDVQKLVWVMWNTEAAKAKAKMTYSATKQQVVNKFKHVNLKHQAADVDDISYNELVDKFGRK